MQKATIGPMTEAVAIHRKAQAGTTPEVWQRHGYQRRARIERLSDRASMDETSRFDFQPAATHVAYCELKPGFPLSDYEAEHGFRVLKSNTTGHNYIILRAVEFGEQKRGGRYSHVRLTLAYSATELLR